MRNWWRELFARVKGGVFPEGGGEAAAAGRLLLLALLTGLAAVSLGKGITNALRDDRSDDFQWEPARLLLAGDNPYRAFLENPGRPRVTTATENNALPNYPATAYVFLAPYGAMAWPAAKVAWAVTNVAGAAGIVWALMLLAGPPGSRPRFWAAAAGLAMLCSSPARDQISAGQHTLFAVCCLLWAWIVGQQPRYRWLAAVLIAASWLKFTVTVPLTVAFPIRGRWREAAGALGLHGALYAAVCGWTATGPLALAGDFLAATRQGVFHSGYTSNLWDSIAVGRALFPSSGAAAALLSLAALGAVAWVAARRRGEMSGLGTLALLALPACVVGFHFRYDFVVFAASLAWVLGNTRDPALQGAALGVAGANWFGARALESRYYEAIDTIHGIWEPAGTIGLGVISAITWLLMAWMVTRIATRRQEPVRTAVATHHGIARPDAWMRRERRERVP